MIPPQILSSPSGDSVRSTITRNARVNDWEIVNEPLAREPDVFADIASEEYIPSAFRWAKDAAPAKRMMINESGVFGSLDHDQNRTQYLKLLEALIKKE